MVWYWLLGMVLGMLIGYGIEKVFFVSKWEEKKLSGDLYRDGEDLYLVPCKKPTEFERGEVVCFKIRDIEEKREKS